MRSLLVSFLFLSALMLASCANSVDIVPAGRIEKNNIENRLTPEELNTDLEFMISTSIEVHPAFYSAVDSAVFAGQIQKVRSKLDKPMTRLEFYKITAPLLTMLNSGHTCMVPPGREWTNYKNNGGRFFPYRISFDEINGMTITSCRDSLSFLPAGTRVLSINGLAADSLFREFRNYRGGERDIWRNAVTANYFTLYTWSNNIDPPYEIEFLSKISGTPGKIKSEGAVSAPDIAPAPQTAAPSYYSYQLLSDSIGYINYLQLADDKNNPFDDFLKKTFTDLKESSARGLIVDLRNNGGGTSDYGEWLLNYITDKPYRLGSVKIWKASAQYKEMMRNAVPWWISWLSYRPFIWMFTPFVDAARMFTADDGELIETHYEYEQPGKNPLRFKGKVCFLIGTGSFSSAVSLAAAVSDCKLAALIGEETGGVPNEFGNNYYFYLPNTQIQITMPSAAYVRPNGDRLDRRGIIPDLEVKQAPHDSERKIDTALEAARKWILE